MANVLKNIPIDPLGFIKNCVSDNQIFWTYHVNMRLEKRFITRKAIIESVGDYEIIESYPDDKYMPSYLVRSVYKGDVFHALFAIDKEKRNVRIITAYYPDPRHWNNSFKKRRK